MNPAASRTPRWLAGLALLGSLGPVAVTLLLVHIGLAASGFLAELGPGALLGTDWRPSAGHFGALSLVGATLTIALLAALVSVPLGTLAAIRLACLAGRRERLVTESAVSILAALPSIVVGLIGLAWLPDGLRFTLLGGSLTLTLASLPTFTLLAAAALRQVPADLWTAGRALGLGESTLILRLVLPAVRRDLLGAALFVLGRALGDATVIALVIGNRLRGPWPDLWGPTNTIATTILKEHGGATGLHQSALYGLALILALLILALSLAAKSLRGGGREGSAC